MDNTSPSSHRIHFLKEKVYKKIAAGEVIERPFSVVRELLDNAIDAKSTEISVYIEKGGLELIRVMDNGSGMTKEDLEICFLPHTTSKIEENEDLYKIHTLGFRGEALASIGVCSNLEITSKTEETETAHQLIVKDGNLISLSESAGQKGTVVVVSKLFYNMPARKQFLKSVSSETRMCNSVLVEKAIAHPQNTFRLYVNKGLNHFFAPGNIQNRIETAYKHLVTPGTLDTITLSEKDFKATLVLAPPNFYRRDRKLFQTFVNKRRIFEYSLFQAVEYAYSGYMPGGQFPIAFLFLDLNPSLVDFNIHPAKKEARIKNLPDIHKGIVYQIKNYLARFNLSLNKRAGLVGETQQNNQNFDFKPGIDRKQPINPFTLPSQKDQALVRQEGLKLQEGLKFLGQALGVFLIAEKNNDIYFIDQHAAHERVLYNELLKEKQPVQELLFPIHFDTSEEETLHIDRISGHLKKIGIQLKSVGRNEYEIFALSEKLTQIEEEELIRMIKEPGLSINQMKEKILSTAACRTAIKDKDIIDAVTACELIQKALALENARCPHGRPIWYKISQKELFKLVGRVI